MSYADASTNKLGLAVLKNARYLVAVVDKHGLVKMLECPGLPWCINGLRVGRQLPESLQAIVDICDESTSTQLFPYVQISDDVHTDVHVLSNGSEAQLILHDVNVAYEGAHEFQQKAHDVSLLLEQQAELNRLLEEKRAEADAANRAKSRFIATMSNEFRSPISSIMAHADALHAERRDAREPAAIQRASWYLLTLLENLLEQARMEEDERKLDLSNVEIPPMLSDMRQLFGNQARSRGLMLKVDNPDQASLVRADEIRLHQVLVNLLSNAMRYTHEGEISLLCRRQGDAIEFCVADTGKGIDEGDLERIFEPFTRINPTGEGSAGLGLTVSRKLVEAMQGELTVQSKTGDGSTFSFSLPIPAKDQLKTIENLEGLSVLLVEDDVDVREMYRIWMEDWGAHVRTVPSCDLAVAEFENDPVDLILTDLFLADGNGVELLTLLRKTRPGLATVLCSSSDSIETYLGRDGAVVDAFICKPVSAKRLESALQTAIRLAKSV